MFFIGAESRHVHVRNPPSSSIRRVELRSNKQSSLVQPANDYPEFTPTRNDEQDVTNNADRRLKTTSANPSVSGNSERSADENQPCSPSETTSEGLELMSQHEIEALILKQQQRQHGLTRHQSISTKSISSKNGFSNDTPPMVSAERNSDDWNIQVMTYLPKLQYLPIHSPMYLLFTLLHLPTYVFTPLHLSTNVFTFLH